MSEQKCDDCDNRGNCSGEQFSSACINHTGYTSKLIKGKLPCNLNDINKQIQLLIEDIVKKLGDNTLLKKKCFTGMDVDKATQKDWNQAFIDSYCGIQTTISQLGSTLVIDPATYMITINLGCLENEACDIPAAYSLLDILTRMKTRICEHETRIDAIETYLGL